MSEQQKDAAQQSARKPRVLFPRLRLTVTKKEGFCYHFYNVGQTFELKDFTHPPQDFCQGAMHSIFPAIYALTFGAEFPFMDNVWSLKTTCPDGKKVEFLCEKLDEKGQVMVKPKSSVPVKPDPKTMAIEVKESSGKCFYGYKVGDTVEVKGLKTPEGFCGAAYHMMFPVLFALNFGARFTFEPDPDSLSTPTCPDGGHIVFKVTRQKGEKKQGHKEKQ